MENQIAIGVDVGGSHVSCAAYDLDRKMILNGTIIGADLDNHASPDEIIERWAVVIEASMYEAGEDNIAGIGFAMPGPYDYEKGISLFTGQNGKYENTYGMNVPQKIREYLGLDDTFKIRFMNDASAFAVGENQAGKTRGFSRALAITLGTGFGAAFIKDALPVVDGDEVPENGSLWHLPFRGSIADDYFSTRGICNRFYAKSGIETRSVKEVTSIAIHGNKTAFTLFADLGTELGQFLLPWCINFGVEVLVVGGNISRSFPLFRREMVAIFESENLEIEVKSSELLESASFIGSATLIDDAFYNRALPAIRKM